MQGVMELATESEKVAPPYVEARLVKAFHCTAPGWIAGRSTLFSMEAECKYTFNSRCISGQNQSTLVGLQGVGMSTSFVAQMSHFNLSLGILPSLTCVRARCSSGESIAAILPCITAPSPVVGCTRVCCRTCLCKAALTSACAL